MTDRLVRGDSQEPVADRPARVVPMERPVRLEERGARHVKRRVAISGDPQRDPVDLVLVLADGVGERQARGRDGRMTKRQGDTCGHLPQYAATITPISSARPRPPPFRPAGSRSCLWRWLRAR